MSEWQPIDTAPKDGGRIMLADQRYMQVAQWWPENDTGDEDGGSWIVYCDLIQEPELHFEPTHWMPLPAPPKEPKA